MASIGTVRTVVVDFRDGQLPQVTIKYDVTDPEAPGLGTLAAERPVTDEALRAAIAAQAEALIPPTSTTLGIPVVLPPGPPPPEEPEAPEPEAE